MKTSLFQIYSKVIGWCNQRQYTTNIVVKLIIKVVENLLHLASAVLSRIKRIQFPKRKLGTRFWIGQWRVEFLMGWWEYETIPWVKELVKPGMTVVDIGAHIGYYTDLFSELTKPQGTVFAFEASPENFPILAHNMKARKRSNVIAYHYAVSDENALLDLYVSPGHSNHSLIAGRTQTEGTVPVQASRLDDFLDVERIDFVKMDVEGAEPRVLDGMRKLIRASKDLVMIVEYNRVVLDKAYPSPQILLDLLTELDFEYKAILDDGSLGEIPSGTKTLNLLCTRKTTA